jgi:hypothetical protein
VDLLIAEGEKAVTGSTPLRTLLANYPANPVVARSR